MTLAELGIDCKGGSPARLTAGRARQPHMPLGKGFAEGLQYQQYSKPRFIQPFLLAHSAIRKRDRAIRRAGELLKQIEAQPGKRTDIEPSGGAPTRLQVAHDAGMSRDQMHTALRVANVPADEFERQVESATPPTVTKLAEQGKQSAPKPVLDLQGRNPDDFNRAMHYVGGWEDAAKDLAALQHERALPVLTPSEIARLRAAITSIDAVTDRIITRI